jgi:uncharacterized OB-fold protein
MTDTEIRTIVEHWDLTYRHSAGLVASEFFAALEQGRILGRRCPSCGRVLLPPRPFCDRCYVDTDAWVEVAATGVLETFTIVYVKFAGLPDPPYAIAYVRLEGADTAILNYVRALDLEDMDASVARLAPGTRIRVVFASPESRTGRVTDFWFEPADE